MEALASNNFPKLPFSPQKVVVVRALYLGDLLCAVPSFRALREAFPQSEITLIGLPWAKEFVKRYSHYLDRFLEFPGYPGMLEIGADSRKVIQFFKETQKEKFDLAIQMHGDGMMSSPFTVLLGAKMTAGYYRRGFPNPGLDFALPNNQEDHEILRNLKMLRMIGVESDDTTVDFPITKADKEELLKLEKEFKFPNGKKLVVIHPGAKAPSRRWDPLRYAELADAIIDKLNVQVVLTGSAIELSLVSQVQENMKGKAINLAGKTSLGALAALLEKATLLISNDTGPAHVAYALNTKSVTIFGGADPRRWAPLETKNHKIIRKNVNCNPCPHFECPITTYDCLKSIRVAEVIELVESLLVEEIQRSKLKEQKLVQKAIRQMADKRL